MLAHDAFGREGSPAVVLIHGWPLDRTIWSDVAPRLADVGFRVLCPDLPAFGRSAALPRDRWTVEAYAEEVARFLRDVRAARVAVAGHSFGGYVALALAHADRDLIAGLALVSSRTTADTDAARAGRLATIEKVRTQGTQALLPDLAGKLVAPGAPDELRARATRAIQAARPEAVIAGLTAMAARPDRTIVLGSLSRPRLVLHGAVDQLIPAVEAPTAARQAGPLERVVLPGVGHMPMWEAPAKTAEALGVWGRSAHGL